MPQNYDMPLAVSDSEATALLSKIPNTFEALRTPTDQCKVVVTP